MAIHTAAGEASRVYSISENRMADGCFLRGGAASCYIRRHKKASYADGCICHDRVRPSSVTFRCFVETNEATIMRFSPGMLVLGLGNEGQVLGLGLGFGLVGQFQGLLKCKSLEKTEVTIKAQVRFLCPITFKCVPCAQHCTMFCKLHICLLYTSPSPRDGLLSRMPSSA